MARHKLTMPFDKFRGTVATPGASSKQTLYDDRHRGNISRNYAKTPNPNTAAQIGQRSRIALCAQAWRALSLADANAWRALAATMNRTNALGFTYTLTGINVFYMVNIYRQLDAQVITTTPPALISIPPPVTAINSIDGIQPNLNVSLNCSGMPDGTLILLRISNGSPYASRQFRTCDLRIPTSNTTLSFSTVAAGQALWSITCDQVIIGFSYFIGIQFTAMSSTFLPRAPWFSPLQFIYP